MEEAFSLVYDTEGDDSAAGVSMAPPRRQDSSASRVPLRPALAPGQVGDEQSEGAFDGYSTSPM